MRDCAILEETARVRFTKFNVPDDDVLTYDYELLRFAKRVNPAVTENAINPVHARQNAT